MQQNLSGKIYWVGDTFTYIGITIPKKDMTHQAAQIDQVVVEDYMIKFFIKPFEWEGDTWSYVVNLVPIEFSAKFKGTAVKENNKEHTAEINCELFSNKGGYFLYGKWTEAETAFTFWVKIIKEDNI